MTRDALLKDITYYRTQLAAAASPRGLDLYELLGRCGEQLFFDASELERLESKLAYHTATLQPTNKG